MRFRRLALPSGLHVGCLDAGPSRPSRASGAPPLVLLHGIGADCGEWALTLPLFARGRRVLAVDLLGHGRSDKPAGPGIEYRIFPLAAGRSLARRLPNARLEVLSRCGHVPPTERPVAFARRVLAFLER